MNNEEVNIYREVNESGEPTGRYVLVGDGFIDIYGDDERIHASVSTVRELYNRHRNTYPSEVAQGIPAHIIKRVNGDITVKEIRGKFGSTPWEVGSEIYDYEPRIPIDCVFWKYIKRGIEDRYWQPMRVWGH